MEYSKKEPTQKLNCMPIKKTHALSSKVMGTS